MGPETFTFEEMVRLIADRIGREARLIHPALRITLLLVRLAGYVVGDVVLTRDEIEGLTAGLLVSEAPPTGQTRLSYWRGRNAGNLGLSYASELDRHYR